MLTTVGIRGEVDQEIGDDIELFLIQCKDTINTLIFSDFHCWNTKSASHRLWEGTDTFWGSFSHISLITADLYQFEEDYEDIPYGPNAIASSQPLTLAIFDPRMPYCANKVKRTARNIIRWCTYPEPPIKRLAIFESWEDFQNPGGYSRKRTLVGIKAFVGEIYGNEMTFCDVNGIDFYDQSNKRLHKELKRVKDPGMCHWECEDCGGASDW